MIEYYEQLMNEEPLVLTRIIMFLSGPSFWV